MAIYINYCDSVESSDENTLASQMLAEPHTILKSLKILFADLLCRVHISTSLIARHGVDFMLGFQLFIFVACKGNIDSFDFQVQLIV